MVTESKASQLGERAAAEIAKLQSQLLTPGLHLVATPIGNLGDITLRALSVLARADLIYCEDTRHSRTLVSHFGIAVPLRPYHEHNAAAERPRIIAELRSGKSIALISDAGTPLVSDPGYKLVRDVLDDGHHVESLPGPSAALAGLTNSGLPSDCFLFAGFLPPKNAGRTSRLLELKNVPATLIFFEAPSRIAETLATMAEVLGPRLAAVSRELTKMHEDIQRGALAELAASFDGRDVKGEIVIVVGPPLDTAASDDDISARLAALLDDMSLRDAAKAVSDMLGVPKARVYDIGLEIKKSRQ